MPNSARRNPAFLAVTALIVASAAALAAAGLQERAGFLWIAESGGVLNIATDSGAVRFEVQTTLGTSALAVNDYNGDVWAYGNRRLLGLDRTGAAHTDVETPVPIHGGDPVDLVVDGGSGTVWLAIKRELYRYDLQGTLRQTLVLPRNIVAATLDRDHSVLWVAQDEQLRLYDADGALRRTVDVGTTERILDIAYDRRRAEIWVAMPDRLRRYDSEGARVWEKLGSYAGMIAPDGAGGLWQARDSVLLNYDAAGTQQFGIEPFAGQANKAIVDLVADPHDGSAWVASRRSIAHYGADGAALALLRDLGDGTIRRLSRGALYADLDPPELTIMAPPANAVIGTNRPTIELGYFDLGVGVDPDSIRLSAGGAVLPASCTADATAARCVPLAPLPEGEVAIRATVADRLLNVSEPAELRLMIATPPAPEVGLIDVGESQAGQVTVVGAAGAVAPGATVRITNLRTGHSVTVIARDHGSFEGTIAADPGDALSIATVDAAGNPGAGMTAQVPAGMTLAVTSPAAHELVPADGILVSGEIRAPGNTGVTVNGIAADLLAAGGTVAFHAYVPLALGPNDLVVKATDPDGRSVSRTVPIVSQGHRPFEVTLTPRQGLAPLTVTLEAGAPDAALAVDFDGDGTFQEVTAPAITHTFAAPGVYSVVVRQTEGSAVAVVVPVVVGDKVALDEKLRGVWADLTAALTDRETEAAARMFTSKSHDLYAQVFDLLGPRLPEALSEFSGIEPIGIAHDFADYAVLTTHNGLASVYVITFIRGPDGIWRIDSI